MKILKKQPFVSLKIVVLILISVSMLFTNITNTNGADFSGFSGVWPVNKSISISQHYSSSHIGLDFA